MAKRQNGHSKNASDEDRLVIQEILSGPNSDQQQAAYGHFKNLLELACQPRHLSGNACVRLCYFLELCRKSSSSNLQNLAFSGSTCLNLFHFYVEWNEKNQHRSMRQILELFVTLIIFNPDKSIAEASRLQILEEVLLIINHQSVQSLVKPAFKVLEFMLSKNAVTTDKLCRVHGSLGCFNQRIPSKGNFGREDEVVVRDSLFSAIFDWMSSSETASAAGRLLATLFEAIRTEPLAGLFGSFRGAHASLWQRWIRQGLIQHPDSLENVKTHLLPQLFKTDRTGALEFLQDLSSIKNTEALTSKEFDGQAILLLSAMEVGKKCGLVVESGEVPGFPNNSLTNSQDMDPLGSANSDRISFPETIIGSFLTHNARNFRSLSFSVLVSSRSSISPFTSYTLDLFKSNLAILHADTDAKFRNEVLSNTKHMLERLKCSISSLSRAHAAALYSSEKSVTEQGILNISRLVLPSAAPRTSLEEHKDFIQWYQRFLEHELIPTTSYQRHITALRALQLAINSGVFTREKESNRNGRLTDEAAWPFAAVAFTETCIRLLLDLLMDPFEDVRSAASDLLRLVPRSCFLDWDYAKDPEGELDIGTIQHTGVIGTGTANCLPNRESDYRKKNSQENLCRLLQCFADHAEDAATRTGRADLADAVSRVNELLCRLAMNDRSRFSLLSVLINDLESRVIRVEQNLAKAVLTAPIHGQFASVRLIYALLSQSSKKITLVDTITSQATHVTVSEFRALQCRIIRCCNGIWQAVRHILCNDSPEGHLPKDIEDMNIVDTKDILSYSFRAIHESSNLLRVMAGDVKCLLEDGTPTFPMETFCEAGNLTFHQLSNLRHRGVVSTVSLTYETYCRISQEMSILGVSGKPLTDEWYQATLKCMFEQTSTTRRSAGIPALIIGILSANSSSLHLEDVVNHLKELARKPILLAEKEETALAQVHAFNSLKEIFKNSHLGARCERHILDCLKLAAESLQSEVWAVRNCALLLLRSLIDCLFSTGENKAIAEAGWDGKSIKLSYERYPPLPELLLQLLDVRVDVHSAIGLDIGRAQSVFPALDIIRRAGPPRQLREEIYRSVAVHLGNAVWNIREIAARTICTLLLGDTWLLEVSNLLQSVGGSANRAHGTLLAIKFLLERRLELGLEISPENVSGMTWKAKQFWAEEASWKTCVTVEVAYRDVIIILQRIAYLKLKSNYKDSQQIDPWDLRAAFATENIIGEAIRLLEAHVDSLERSNPHPGTGSSLLIRATAVRALHAAAFNSEIHMVYKIIDLVARIDVDIACSMLEHIPLIWEVRNNSVDMLKSLAGVYIRILARIPSSSIRSIAIRNLSDIVESLGESGIMDPVIGEGLCLFGASSCLFRSPDLSNSEIRISGSVLAHDFALGTGSPSRIDKKVEAWGHMLNSCGNAFNDFEIRYAAIAALRAFYGAFGPGIFLLKNFMVQNPARCCFLPSLLALYDTLNDDDDEIRDVAAAVVYRILGTNWAPLAASREFLLWLRSLFGETAAFCNIVLQRVTDNDSANIDQLEPVGPRLAAAMVDDDSLFIEEEQNLYRDEVRETLAWTSVLSNMRGPQWDNARNQLLSWAVEGLGILERLAKAESSLYGWWTSKPKVFAISMMIIVTADTLLGHSEGSCLGKIPPKFNMDIGKTVTKETGSEVEQNKEDLGAAVKSLLAIGRKSILHPLFLDELYTTRR